MRDPRISICFLAFLAGLGLLIAPPAQAGGTGDSPAGPECDKLLATVGILLTAKSLCDFHGDPDPHFMGAAKACMAGLSEGEFDRIAKAGVENVDDQVAKLGRARACQGLLDRYGEQLGKSKFMELERDDSEFTRLFYAGQVEQALELARRWESRAALLVGRTHKAYAQALLGLVISSSQARDSDEWVRLGDQLISLEKDLYGENSEPFAETLNNIGVAYLNRGQGVIAEPILRRAVRVRTVINGPEGEQTEETQMNLAASLVNRPLDKVKIQEALSIYDQLLAFFQKQDHGGGERVALIYFNIGSAYLQEDEVKQAIPYFERSVQMEKKLDSIDERRYLQFESTLAKAYFELDDWASAKKYYSEAVPLAKRVVGEASETYISLVDLLGRAQAMIDGEKLTALEKEKNLQDPLKDPEYSKQFGDLVSNYIEQKGLSYNLVLKYLETGQLSEEQVVKEGWIKDIFSRYLGGLITTRELHLKPQDQLSEESFLIGQLVARSAADVALNKMASRFARADDRLASMLHDEDDTVRRIDALEHAVLSAAGAGDADREVILRAQVAALQDKNKSTKQAVEHDFEKFSAAATPAPMSVKDTQALLDEDEALVLFVPFGNFLDSWAITKRSFKWSSSRDASSPAGPKTVEEIKSAPHYDELTSRFRRGLDLASLQNNSERPFDLEGAYELYKTLFGPLESELAGKTHLIIVPSGPLTALPFQVLVTKPPAGKEDWRAANWIIRDHAISVIPSVRSLKALRATAVTAWGAKELIGFADPIFGPSSSAAAGKTATRGATLSYSGVWNGVDVDRNLLASALPPLPDTRDELLEVARDLHVPDADIHFGANANKQVLLNAKLSDYHILYFATHGLVSGEVGGLGEPALALSIPPPPAAAADALLTASEISGLNLNADWVVLSACNTMAGDHPGGEALSGLARAFFYAGARALLVTHWSVQSAAAARIAERTFELIAANGSLPRDEALRRAMLEMIDSLKPGDEWSAYPGVWGAFALIGDNRALSSRPQSTLH